MISVIVYGRNDAHGYNLHKRAAISLNCIAAMLSSEGDEILFVDYNTPNDLPTFIEAIYDTLTSRAKSLLRVFRVRPQLHARLVTERTHLQALEPHSRNIALRRSNPRNRWILSTNTDMVFIPRDGVSSLGGAVEDLPDGLYTLPRFELPEPLWEAFPRADPPAIMRACAELGAKLHLDEVCVDHPYVRFHSNGDFQLAPRQALFDIHGFDEGMIHGWHADSNLCKRLFLFYGGRTESLAHRLKGYHCDHTRVATLAHRLDVKLQNDLQEFVYGVEHPVARGQAETWGAPSEFIEEVDFERGAQVLFASAMERTLGAPQSVEYYSDANDLRNFVYYRPEHALPYLAANLTTYPRDARFAYVGNNPTMLRLAACSIAEMGFTEPLRYARALLPAGEEFEKAAPISTADLLSGNNLLIFDFGLDPSGLKLGAAPRITDWPRPMRYSLGRVARILETCVEQCQAPESQHPIPEVLVLNANHHVFREFAGQFLVATETPYNTHVRKGRPRVGDERRYRSHQWKYTEECMRSFFGYDMQDDSVATLLPVENIDLTSAARSADYKDGDWGIMDVGGTWTDGTHASVLLCPPSPDEDLLALVRIVEAFTGPTQEPIRIQVLFEGELLARWTVGSRYSASTFRVLLPAHLVARKRICRLTFHIENPQSPQIQASWSGHDAAEDPRQLGVKVQRITFAATDRLRYRIGEEVDFRDTGAGEVYLNEFWTQPDGYGTWTLGPLAGLDLHLDEAIEGPVHACFFVTDAAASGEYPHMNVSVLINQHEVGRWKLWSDRRWEELQIVVPAEVLRAKNPVNVSFRVETPRSPAELKWAEGDTRPLGFRLTKIQLKPVDRREPSRIELSPGGNGRQVQLWNFVTAGLRWLRVAMRGGG